MKSINENTRSQARIIRLKKRVGMIYGAAVGIAFALTSWGRDGYILSTSHAYYPWVMLLVGLFFCAILGGICGRLTARFDSGLLGVVFWIIAAAGFAWLMVALPLRINPAIVSRLDPQLGALLTYENKEEFLFRFGVSLAWMISFMLIIGVTQLPVTEPAVFSPSIFGKIAPFVFGMVVMVISGTLTDSLINSHFRDAIVSLDETIQFVVDNKGNENTDPVLSRQLHARALKTVEEHVQESRYLFVAGYDEYLGDLNILVKFGDQWVDCNVLYSQPNICKALTGE